MSIQTVVTEVVGKVEAEFKAVEAAVIAGLEHLNPFAGQVETKVEATVDTVEAAAAPVVAQVEGQVQAAVAPVVAEVQAQVAQVVTATEAKVVSAAGAAASSAVASVLPKA